MAELKKIHIPNIGDFDSVEVIEIMVKVGDKINIEDSLITVESDKASMDIPSPASGLIKSLDIKVGDEKVGSLVNFYKQENNIFKVLVELRIEKIDARPTLNGNEILSLEMQY